MQKNWNGKSVGAEINFKVEDQDIELKIFTTRPDTICGATYVIMAPEHPLVTILTKELNRKEVHEYIEETSRKREIDRLSQDKKKTGVFTGSYVINPINGEKIPIWIGDSVLYFYGTGVVMAVPAHDERDFEFAKTFNLEIKKVVLQSGTKEETPIERAFIEEGTLINSGIYNGLTSKEAAKKIVADLEKMCKGIFKIKYRLRDWLVSRQRYWGAPIPIVYCGTCGEVPISQSNLPVELPYDVTFRYDGKSPLVTNPDFLNTKCPKCNKEAKREVDTLDTFVCSSWYFLRFPDNKNSNKPFDINIINKILPVDKYIGGPEHACMHLLYARFITKALADMGYLNFREPFTSLTHQGIILSSDGRRMSKSKGNTISPDSYIEEFGSDVFRFYLMFGFNFIEGGQWSDSGIIASAKFLNRVWDIIEENKYSSSFSIKPYTETPEHEKASKYLLAVLHNTIKSITEDTEKFQFNTSIAKIMELISELKLYNKSILQEKRNPIFVKEITETIVKLLAPFIPHLAEEFWEKMGHKTSVFNEKWPSFDNKFLMKDKVTMAVQVNGKLRTTITVDSNANEDLIKETALASKNVIKYTMGNSIKKIIIVPKKLISIVIKNT